MLPSINSILTLRSVAFCPVAFFPSVLLSYGLLSVAFCPVVFCTVAFCRGAALMELRDIRVSVTLNRRGRDCSVKQRSDGRLTVYRHTKTATQYGGWLVH